MMKRQSGRTEVILPDKNDNKKPEKDFQFWLKSAGWVWLALVVVFSCYWSSFFLGNHDFRFIRYGVPVDAGVFEGRFMQFVLPKLLVDGHILPVLNVFLGFAFFALGVVLLARWFGLAEKYREVLPFALLIVLNPYILTQLYYVHQILPILFWHLLCVLGVIWMDKAAEERRPGLAAAGVLALWTAMGGYAASLELVLTIIVGKFWLDVLRMNSGMKEILRRYIFIGLMVATAAAAYAATVKILQAMAITDMRTYNVQVLRIGELWETFWQRRALPWWCVWTPFPHNPTSAAFCLAGLAVLALAVSAKRGKTGAGVICFVGIVYAAFGLAFLARWNFFDTFRMHFYSVPCLAGVLYAVVRICGSRWLRNVALGLAAVMLAVYADVDFATQKIWLLGNRQDEAHAERIRGNLLPRLESGQHYRLTTMGGLYGRAKFAKSANVAEAFNRRVYERHREFFGASFYLHVMFSSGLFLYEPDNPIWGDALFINGRVFYGTTSELLPSEKDLSARTFAYSPAKDLDARLRALHSMEALSPAKCFFVGEKDIFLMLPEMQQERNSLMRYILGN